jgi:hypothetical protein
MKVYLTILLLVFLVGPAYAKKPRKLPCIPKDQFNAAVDSGASTASYAPPDTASLGETPVTKRRARKKSSKAADKKLPTAADLAHPPEITPRPVCDGKKSGRPYQGRRRKVHR